jgi:trehalose synthase
VTSLVIEHFGAPSTTRDARAFDRARDRTIDELAGRTVWCATALPAGLDPAQQLRASLGWASDGGVATGWLEVAADEPLHALAQQLADMLLGAPGAQEQPGPAEREIYAQGVGSGEDLVGRGVRRDDVVVLHDPLTALLAEAVRERGAHAVWRLNGEATAGEAWASMRPYTSALDAYVVASSRPGPGGTVVEEVAALMPSAGVVAAKEIQGDAPAAAGDAAAAAGHDVGWISMLADVVQTDRGESVGGTRHPRPAVAAR